MTSPAVASAAREPLAICAVTAATAANTIPMPIIDAPKANEPAAGSPNASSATMLPTAITALTSNVPIIADARAAWRPTGAARTSSARSASSSVRVCRTTMNTLITAAAMNIHCAVSFITTAPSVGSSRP